MIEDALVAFGKILLGGSNVHFGGARREAPRSARKPRPAFRGRRRVQAVMSDFFIVLVLPALAY